MRKTKPLEEMEALNKLITQLNELLKDFSALSKNKPNDQVNKFKLSLVNKILERANATIDKKNRPFDDFNVFDEKELPSNSDVVLILTQYAVCLAKFRRERSN